MSVKLDWRSSGLTSPIRSVAVGCSAFDVEARELAPVLFLDDFVLPIAAFEEVRWIQLIV